MEEYKKNVIEGLKLLVDGLLDETNILCSTSGMEKETDVLKYRMEKIKSYLKEAENIHYFPKEDLKLLKMKYGFVNSQIK